MTVVPKITQYKYIKDSSNIYFIGKAKPSSFRQHVCFTEPYYIKERKELRNAIIGFTNPKMAEAKLDSIECDVADENCKGEHNIYMIPLSDLKCISSIMMMPLVVEAESFCDLIDGTERNNIYFYHKQEYTSAKNILNSKNRYV